MFLWRVFPLRWHRLIGSVLFLFFVAAFAGCIDRTTVQEQRVQGVLSVAPEVKVAAVWPYAARGTLFWEGMQLALDEINARGGARGRTIRVIKLDDQSSVTEGMAVAQSLALDPTLLAVIGHRSSFVALPAAEVYDRAGLIYIAPSSTAPELTQRGYERTFRTIPSDHSIGRQMAQFVAAEGYERIAIAYTEDAYGRGLAAAFEDAAEQLGVRVVDRIMHFGDVQNVRQRVATWRAFDYDAIFVAATSSRVTDVVSLIRRAGADKPIFGGDAFDGEHLLALPPHLSEGIVFASVFDAGKVDGDVQRFARDFKDKFGVEPDTWAAQGYDALHLLAHAVEEAEALSPDAVAAVLRGVSGWRGVTGLHTFDQTGEIVDKPIVHKTVVNGRFVMLRR